MKKILMLASVAAVALSFSTQPSDTPGWYVLNGNKPTDPSSYRLNKHYVQECESDTDGELTIKAIRIPEGVSLQDLRDTKSVLFHTVTGALKKGECTTGRIKVDLKSTE